MRTLDHRSEEGFTLIELMVVVLIIGILVAIALPTFLGARTRAQDAAAKSRLKNAVTGASAYFADKGSFDGFDTPGVPEAEETSISWAYGGAAQVGKVTINLASGNYLVLSAKSESTTFFCAAMNYGVGGSLVRGGVDANGATAVPVDLICVVGTW